VDYIAEWLDLMVCSGIGSQERAALQILPGSGFAQPASNGVSPALPVVGPAAPAAPIEPARRVTANRNGGRADLPGQQPSHHSHHSIHARGRLIDLSV
jgi:hypothetical protein